MFSKENHPERVAVIVDHLNTIPNLTPQKVFDELAKIWELLGEKLQPRGWSFARFQSHVNQQAIHAQLRAQLRTVN